MEVTEAAGSAPAGGAATPAPAAAPAAHVELTANDETAACNSTSTSASTPPASSHIQSPSHPQSRSSPLGSVLSPGTSTATTSTSATTVTTASSPVALSRRSTPVPAGGSPPASTTTTTTSTPVEQTMATSPPPHTLPPRTPSPFPMSPPRASVSMSTSSVSVSTKLESPRRPGVPLFRGGSGSGREERDRERERSGAGGGVGAAHGGLKASTGSTSGTRSTSGPGAPRTARPTGHEGADSSEWTSKRERPLPAPMMSPRTEGRSSPAPNVTSSATGALGIMTSKSSAAAGPLNVSTSTMGSTSSSRASPSPSPGRSRSRRSKDKDKEEGERGSDREQRQYATDSTPPLSRTHSRRHSRSQSQSHSFSQSHSHTHSMDSSVPEAEVEDVAAVGVVAASDVDVRRELRELVAAGAGGSATPSRLIRTPSARARQPVFNKRRYYVLTNAGKPVFSIGHDDDDALTNMMGVAQALISIFAQDDDRPRTILRGRTRTTFMLKPPLYLFAVSDWGEPDYVLRMHLEYINLQILSVVSAVQLSRAFQRRSNFDLSRLLEGSEPYLNKLVAQCQDDLSFLTVTLQPLRMAPALRDTAAAALTPPAKFKDLLYVLLIAGGRIVTLLRPRRHTVHPSDMHLLLNTLATSATLRTVETWLPICLPKFNPAGFVHAYISFVREDVGLVFISADRDAFEPLCGWRAAVVETLKRDGALDKIEASIKAHPYSVAAVGSSGLRHFVYKSRGIVQLTAPEWEAPYTPDSEDRKRLVTLYEKVQDMLYARSGQPTPLKLVYMANGHEAVLGWLTKPFELYIAVSPHLPMSAVVGTANRVAKWVNAEESRLFLKDAPVF